MLEMSLNQNPGSHHYVEIEVMLQICTQLYLKWTNQNPESEQPGN